MWIQRLKAALHLWLDPILSLPDDWQARRVLRTLPDGDYGPDLTVPYYAQFASSDLIYDYIHHAYDGTHDPNWESFGAPEPADYAFWSHRVCALACLKMAAEAFDPAQQRTLWDLVQMGLAARGYTVQDDQGWYYPALVQVGRQVGLEVTGHSYVSLRRICALLHAGYLVAATVTPEIGEREPNLRRYGGHLVLVYGFRWEQGQPVVFKVHNPSGRFPELRSNAHVSAASFATTFAYRCMALRPVT